MRQLAFVFVLAATCCFSTSAFAQGNGAEACIEAHGKAQELRGARKLIEAREQLAKCVAVACPGAIRRDCGEWLERLDAELPTVVVSARDAAGRDVAEAKLFVDGKLAAESLDGAPIRANPGPHKVRVEIAGSPAVEQTVVLREGETLRRLEFRIAASPPSPPVVDQPKAKAPAKSAPTSPGVDANEAEDGRSIAPWVLGGVGLAGGVVFAVFALKGKSAERDLEACGPRCPESDRSRFDTMNRDYLIADIGLGVGLLAIAGAGLWVALDTPSRDRAAAWQLGVSNSGLRARARF